jgi:hypothetical protein
MKVQRLLGKLFPLIAIAGLLLAGYALITTPEEIQADQNIARWGAPQRQDLLPGSSSSRLDVASERQRSAPLVHLMQGSPLPVRFSRP